MTDSLTPQQPCGALGVPAPEATVTHPDQLCVVYTSEDKVVVGKLVGILRKHWTVWCALDLTEGDWDDKVRAQILACNGLVAVMSAHMKGDRRRVIKDELRLANKNHKRIFPFMLGDAEIPLGLGDYQRTDAFGWAGLAPLMLATARGDSASRPAFSSGISGSRMLVG